MPAVKRSACRACTGSATGHAAGRIHNVGFRAKELNPCPPNLSIVNHLTLPDSNCGHIDLQDEQGMEESAIAQTRVSKAQAREILQASLPIPGDVQQNLNHQLLAIGSAARLKALQVRKPEPPPPPPPSPPAAVQGYTCIPLNLNPLPIPGHVQQNLNHQLLAIGSAAGLKSLQVGKPDVSSTRHRPASCPAESEQFIAGRPLICASVGKQAAALHMLVPDLSEQQRIGPQLSAILSMHAKFGL